MGKALGSINSIKKRREEIIYFENQYIWLFQVVM
jgi:hypothetical protein